jgi:hypothetical protein
MRGGLQRFRAKHKSAANDTQIKFVNCITPTLEHIQPIIRHHFLSTSLAFSLSISDLVG